MSIILHIDTATNDAFIGISANGNLLYSEASLDNRNHASFLQPAIKRLFDKAQLPIKAIDAIAVSNGPGSYTGLRVGLSTAKALCFALEKPLLLINTLEIMALAAKEAVNAAHENYWLVPMIDARRMEVFTAVYHPDLSIAIQPSALVLNQDVFAEIDKNRPIYFFGDGSNKFQPIHQFPNAEFLTTKHTAAHLGKLAFKYFQKKAFANLAYAEPFYLKAVYTTLKL